MYKLNNKQLPNNNYIRLGSHEEQQLYNTPQNLNHWLS
jgi:hypothetical protein